MRYSALVTVLAATMAATATTAVAELADRDMGAPIGRVDNTAIEPGAVRVDGMGAVQGDQRDPRMEPLGNRESAAALNELSEDADN